MVRISRLVLRMMALAYPSPRRSSWRKNRSREDPLVSEQFETIVVERPDPAVTRIVMNRPEARNAQNLQMTYDLNAAFDKAVQDDAVKVIILAGNGPHFSAGHDLRRPARTRRASISRQSEIGAASPNPMPTAVSRASRRSTCRSHGAGAIWQNRRSRKSTASALPAG